MRGELHGAFLTGEWFAGGEGIHGFLLVCFTLITNILMKILLIKLLANLAHCKFGPCKNRISNSSKETRIYFLKIEMSKQDISPPKKFF